MTLKTLCLLQVDTMHAVAAVSGESGIFFWTIASSVVGVAALTYWLFKRVTPASAPVEPLHVAGYSENGVKKGPNHRPAETGEKGSRNVPLVITDELAEGSRTIALEQKPQVSETRQLTVEVRKEVVQVAAKPPVAITQRPPVRDAGPLGSPGVETPAMPILSPPAASEEALLLDDMEKQLDTYCGEAGLTGQDRTKNGVSELVAGNRGSGVGKALVTPVPAVEKVSSVPKFIGYQPFEPAETGTFPQVRLPKAGCVIKFPRVGRSGRRGYKEADFMQIASRLLGSGAVKVYDDRHVPTPNAQSPYEPDLVVQNELNGLNLFLNVEIDEPYDGVYRQPIHCLGEDAARNQFFASRGWVVVRFAEIQVHQQPEACCAYVAQLISQLDLGYEVPAALRGLTLQPVTAWDVVQAQKWQKERYREKYLKIANFGTRQEGSGWVPPAALPGEVETEKLVKPTISMTRLAHPPKSRLDGKLAHQRDTSLQFDPEAHQYFINGQPATAVSTLVNRFFPEYNKHKWAPGSAVKRGITTEEMLAEWDLKGKTSAALGTRLHEHIEEFYKTGDTKVKMPEFKYFLDFHADNGHLTPHSAEWRVFNEELMIAGTVDFVATHADGTVSIYDWKRSEKVINRDGSIQQNFYQTAEGPLGDLDDSKFNRYSIQQNLYKWLLESKYKCQVRGMHLVVLHPGYAEYTVLDVPDRSQHVKQILKSLQSNV